jgi:hypothetical protein
MFRIEKIRESTAMLSFQPTPNYIAKASMCGAIRTAARNAVSTHTSLCRNKLKQVITLILLMEVVMESCVTLLGRSSFSCGVVSI